MNVCKQFKCDTCETLIDCRIGMSNRDIQPFQFACPICEESISFTYGIEKENLEGATDVVAFQAPFKGVNPFVDLHLDFPISFGKYEQGNTAYFKVLAEIGHEAYSHLNRRLSMLNILYPRQRQLERLITQYRRNDIKAFGRVSEHIPGVSLKSHAKQDVLAALYSATSIMSSPFTVHQHNVELSNETPDMLRYLHATYDESFVAFIELMLSNNFLKNLHYDCLSLYPKIVALDLPLRPALYYDYVEEEVLRKTPTRVSTADFDGCSNFYKDLAEVFSRQLVLVAGLNNLIHRGDFDLFSDLVRLNKYGVAIKDFSSLDNFANVDLGRKIDALDDPFYKVDHSAIDHKLRNGIAHYKYEYKASTQLITYYPQKEGMQREKFYELYFMEFMRKILLLFREVHSLNHIIKAILYYCIFILKKDV